MDVIETFERLLAQGQDTAMLRFGLARAYLDRGDLIQAEAHLRQALQLDPKYSAAWKLLGKTLTEAGQAAAALDTYAEGIRVAEERGDIQAAKEMTVFRKRLEKGQGA